MEYYSANKNDEIMLKLQHRDCSEWSKSDRGEISYDIPYVQNLKRNDTNEITKQKQTHSLTLPEPALLERPGVAPNEPASSQPHHGTDTGEKAGLSICQLPSVEATGSRIAQPSSVLVLKDSIV